jgi:hypothetical protein
MKLLLIVQQLEQVFEKWAFGKQGKMQIQNAEVDSIFYT